MKKFARLPRHALDHASHLDVAKKLNAMRNGKITDEKGNVIGNILYADGNTIWQVAAGGLGNLHFQQPDIELDPTIAVEQWTIVNVSPSNPIATTGLKDLVTGIVTNAPTGYWVAVVAIPAQTGTPPAYNVPFMPPSVAWVSSPGSQKGDLDQPGILWLPLPRTGSCV
jgi:hypothetical protein